MINARKRDLGLILPPSNRAAIGLLATWAGVEGSSGWALQQMNWNGVQSGDSMAGETIMRLAE
jgi:hypothetical protein